MPVIRTPLRLAMAPMVCHQSDAGAVTVSGNMDFELRANYALIVRVSDGELANQATLTINVTDVNEAPI